MRNELQRHKRSDKIKWIITGILFVLVAVMLTGICLQIFGTGKAKPSEWFKKSDSEQTEQFPAEGGENETAYTRVRAMVATFSVESDTDEDGISLLASTDTVEWTKTVYVPIYTDYNTLHLQTLNCDISLVSYFLSNGTKTYYLRVADFAIPYDFYSNYSAYVGTVCFKDGYSVTIPDFRKKIGNLGSALGLFDSDDRTIQCEYKSETDLDYMSINMIRKSLSLPEEPKKEGYLFDGWYMGAGQNCGVDCVAYAGEQITAEMQFHAHWRANTFTVTFDSAGGSAVNSQTVEFNTAVSLSTPYRPKYAFKGWFLPDGTQYINQPVTTNITLTAHWERNEFSVTFDADGGSTSVSETTVLLGNSISLPTATKTGFIFMGWFLSDGTEYTNQSVTEDIRLIAYWEIQKFTVTFYVDGEVYVTKTVEYGQSLGEVAEAINLKMLSVRTVSGAPSLDESGIVIVTEDCAVEAQEMSDTDKAINTVKNNKWAIIGGVAGGIALIAIIAAVCGGAKRKRRR